MSPPPPRWRQVLALPGVPALLVGAVLGRLAYGVLPVAVFLSLLQSSGSVRDAAVLSAVQGLVASVVFPWKGRLVDRFGATALWGPAVGCLAFGLGALLTSATVPLFPNAARPQRRSPGQGSSSRQLVDCLRRSHSARNMPSSDGCVRNRRVRSS